MITIEKTASATALADDAEANLKLLVKVAAALFEGEADLIAVLANLSALINSYLEDINWVGFYLIKGDALVLGPFQGAPACSRIERGKGVCGRAAADKKTQIVPDVHQFPGHIACDSASNSELVIPLFRGTEVFGVLDLDSPLFNRFTTLEAEYLGQVAALVGKFLDKICP